MLVNTGANQTNTAGMLKCLTEPQTIDAVSSIHFQILYKVSLIPCLY